MGSLLPKAEKAFPPGVHVPSLTWFKDDTKQEIDWALQKRHLQFLVQSALHGVVLAGTNGEAVTLTSSEKARLIQLTREIGNEAGRRDLPITAGCGGQCTRDVIAETNVAADAGADFALVLTPSYFHFAMDQDAIVAFFQEVRTFFANPSLHFLEQCFISFRIAMPRSRTRVPCPLSFTTFPAWPLDSTWTRRCWKS